MNAIVIEQSQDETRLAIEVHQNAAIARVRLARAKLVSQPREEAARVPITVAFHFKTKAISAPANTLRLEIAFRMAGVSENASSSKKTAEERKPAPVVLVECAYEVDYDLREGFAVTPEHVKAFKDGNAIFNTWPYFREYLQNNLQRMGMPALTAPFLRLQPKPKARKRGKREL